MRFAGRIVVSSSVISTPLMAHFPGMRHDPKSPITNSDPRIDRACAAQWSNPWRDPGNES